MIPVEQAFLFMGLFFVTLFYLFYMGQILFNFLLEVVGDARVISTFGGRFSIDSIRMEMLAFFIIQCLQSILQRFSLVHGISVMTDQLLGLHLSVIQGKNLGQALIIGLAFGGDLVGGDGAQLWQVYFFIKAERFFQFHLLLEGFSMHYGAQTMEWDGQRKEFRVITVFMRQNGHMFNLVGQNYIKIMGNCFASSEKPINTRKLQASPSKNQIVELQALKLQDYLHIDNQDLKIDVFDINTTTHPAFSQIAKDIDRTYPQEDYFKNPQNKLSFERLLKRIALHYPKLGYTQGINFVAGYFLLQGMSEVQAYKSFVRMLVDQDLMFFGLYEDLFPLARLYCSLFWKLLKIKCKKFAQKIEDISLPDEMWIFQWFICFFIYNFPIQYIGKIFRFVLKQKKFAMVRLALGIMIHLEGKFKKSEQFQEDFVQCMESLKQYSFCKEHLPISKIISLAQGVDPSEITSLLSKQSDNWYEDYFAMSNESRAQNYSRFINQKDKDRLEFFGKVKSGISIVTYERHRESVEVIEDIQTRKAQRYRNLYHSVGEKLHGSLMKLSKRRSLRDDLILNRNMVQSITHN